MCAAGPWSHHFHVKKLRLRTLGNLFRVAPLLNCLKKGSDFTPSFYSYALHPRFKAAGESAGGTVRRWGAGQKAGCFLAPCGQRGCWLLSAVQHLELRALHLFMKYYKNLVLAAPSKN